MQGWYPLNPKPAPIPIPAPIPTTNRLTRPTPAKPFALMGYQDPSGRDVVREQNEDIYTRMNYLITALEGMTTEMRMVQPMSPSILKLSTSCKKLAVDIEEEIFKRKGYL